MTQSAYTIAGTATPRFIDSVELDVLNFRQLVRILRRRRFLITSVVIFFTTLVFAYFYISKPAYKADIDILVEGKSGPFVVLDEQSPAQIENDTTVDDAVEVLKSRKLAGRVIDQLDLINDPEFREGSAFPQWSSRIFGVLFNPVRSTGRDAATQHQIERDQVIQAFLDDLSVERIDRSSVVTVSFTSETPETAWRVMNAVGDNYLVWRTEQKFENARKANAWLEDRTRDLEDNAQRADKVAEEYRSAHGLLEGERVALITEQISKLNSNLIDVSSERKAAEADLSQVKRLISAGDVTSAPQVLDSELYVRLRQEELLIEREDAEQSREFGSQLAYSATSGKEGAHSSRHQGGGREGRPKPGKQGRGG
jgi:polysaccharide biosynthesis transport protein